MKSVGIIGVGLIGGSFGLALRKAGFEGGILGVSSARSIEQAVERGAVDRARLWKKPPASIFAVPLAADFGNFGDASEARSAGQGRRAGDGCRQHQASHCG